MYLGSDVGRRGFGRDHMTDTELSQAALGLLVPDGYHADDCYVCLREPAQNIAVESA